MVSTRFGSIGATACRPARLWFRHQDGYTRKREGATTTNDSELERLQCYPFHLPAKWEITINGEPVTSQPYIAKLEEIAPCQARQLYQGEWNAGNDAEIVGELLETAGIPEEPKPATHNLVLAMPPAFFDMVAEMGWLSLGGLTPEIAIDGEIIKPRAPQISHDPDGDIAGYAWDDNRDHDGTGNG